MLSNEDITFISAACKVLGARQTAKLLGVGAGTLASTLFGSARNESYREIRRHLPALRREIKHRTRPLVELESRSFTPELKA